MRPSLILVTLLCYAGFVMAAEPSHGTFTTSDGLKIHYLELGDGPPVVLMHGYTSNAEWKWFKPGIASALAKEHRVVAIDARGHGLSDKPHDPTMYGPRMAVDVIELMDHLEIEQAHIHGFSMGGSILTWILASYPERVTSAIYGGMGVAETDPEWKARVPSDPDPSSAPGTPRSEPWAEYPGFDRVALSALRERPPWEEADNSIDLTKVEIPVMALIGEYDLPNARTHRMHRELKDFRLVVLPGDTHGSAHFNPLYTQSLVEFLAP